MPFLSRSSEPGVYQLRVVLRAVSPLIWRRVLVRSDPTIADLHMTLQTALGWTDEHLNRFVIHGREYGVWHDGGIGFRDNPRHVHRSTLAFESVSSSSMSMTSPTAGSTRCALSRSCRSSQGGPARSASAADAQRHPK